MYKIKVSGGKPYIRKFTRKGYGYTYLLTIHGIGEDAVEIEMDEYDFKRFLDECGKSILE